MKTSTEIASIAKHVGEEKAVLYVARAGFDAWDFSMFDMVHYDWKKNGLLETGHPLGKKNYLAFARELRKIGEDNGIVCNQSHAPFPVCSPAIRDYLRRSIECTAEAGGTICVIHPDNNKSPEENAQMFLELLPFAKDHGVKIATENMWNWDSKRGHAAPAACSDEKSFLDHLNAVNDPYLVACLDIGHAEMEGLGTSAEKMILALGDKLQALHIHDNNLHDDSHAIPFSMKIDFDKVVRALKAVDYKGDFTLEADTHLMDLPLDRVEAGVKELADSARKLADLFDAI